MDSTALQQWQRLHLRVVCGETLSREEQDLYRAGLRELEQSEDLGTNTIARIKEMRQKIRVFDTQLAALTAERECLDEEIRRLEAALDEHTRQQLAELE